MKDLWTWFMHLNTSCSKLCIVRIGEVKVSKRLSKKGIFSFVKICHLFWRCHNDAESSLVSG